MGIGTFITQYFHIASRLHLHSTAYAMAEQGKGNYHTSVILPPNYMAPTLQSNMVPDKYRYRERNFFAGLDFGASYFLTSNWILQTNINLFQFENFRNTNAGKRILPIELPRQVEQKGSGFFVPDRSYHCSFGGNGIVGEKVIWHAQVAEKK